MRNGDPQCGLRLPRNRANAVTDLAGRSTADHLHRRTAGPSRFPIRAALDTDRESTAGHREKKSWKTDPAYAAGDAGDLHLARPADQQAVKPPHHSMNPKQAPSDATVQATASRASCSPSSVSCAAACGDNGLGGSKWPRRPAVRRRRRAASKSGRSGSEMVATNTDTGTGASDSRIPPTAETSAKTTEVAIAATRGRPRRAAAAAG